MSCIARVYHYFHTGSLQQIFSLVSLHFGKLQNNIFTESIPKISTDSKINSTYHRLRKKNKLCLPSVPTASRSGPEHIWLLNSVLFFLLFILKTNNRKRKILREECYSSFIANSENSFLMLIRYADISRLLY